MQESAPKVQVITAGGVGRRMAKPEKATGNASDGETSLQNSKASLPSASFKNNLEMERPSDAEPELSSDDNNTDEELAEHQLHQYKDNPAAHVSFQTQPLPPTADSQTTEQDSKSDVLWLLICFLGIMASFVAYGLLLERSTSGGRQIHELSFLFVTSGLYTLTAAAGRYVRDEQPTTIPPARFAVLGLTSMGSTFCSVRSLRYVIYPLQVLAKSCKPVPVMLMGAVMGKKCK